MSKPINYCIVFFFLLLGSQQLSAQKAASIITDIKKTADGRTSFIRFSNDVLKDPAYKNNGENVRKLLGLNAAHSFTNARTIAPGRATGANRTTLACTRFDQYFKGIPVLYGVITTHSSKEHILQLSGSYYDLPAGFSVVPVMDENAAFNAAVKKAGATLYSWQDSSFSHPFYKQRPTGTLVICKDFSDSAALQQGKVPMRLAYQFRIYATQPLACNDVYIDAINGKEIHQNAVIKHAGGPADTRYSGQRNIATTYDVNSKVYLLKDSGSLYNFQTYNLKTTKAYIVAKPFSDRIITGRQLNLITTPKDNAALDVHWATMKTLEYWRSMHNRRSYDDSGAKVNSYVHYDYGYANAFWDGAAHDLW